MNKSILDVFNIILSASGSQVSFRVKIPLKIAVYSSSQREQSYIKLPSLIQ